MWSSSIVMAPPIFDQDLGLSQGVEDLPVQQFIAHLAIEALDVAVLPGTAALNEQGFHTQLAQPLPYSLGREL